MPDHLLIVSEGTQAKDQPGGPQIVLKKKYRVLVECGLRKGGKDYPKDSIVEMEAKAGARFVAINEVEEIRDEK